MVKFRFITTLAVALAAALVAGFLGKSWLMGMLAGLAALNGSYLGLAIGYTYVERAQGSTLDFKGASFGGWAAGIGLTIAIFLPWLWLLTNNRDAAIIVGMILLGAEAALTWRLQERH